jgi:hypothetical protein
MRACQSPAIAVNLAERRRESAALPPGGGARKA